MPIIILQCAIIRMASTLQPEAGKLAAFGAIEKADKVLEFQERKFARMQTSLGFKSVFLPSTQPLQEIVEVQNRPTALTRYDVELKKPFKGVLKRKGRDPKKVEATIGFLIGLEHEEAYHKKLAYKKARAQALKELKANIIDSYTNSGLAGNHKAINNLAVFLTKQGRQEEAGELFELAAHKNKRKTLILNNWGEWLEANGRWEEAKKAYDISSENGCQQAIYNRAMLHLKDGEYKDAKKLLKSFICNKSKEETASSSSS